MKSRQESNSLRMRALTVFWIYFLSAPFNLWTNKAGVLVASKMLPASQPSPHGDTLNKIPPGHEQQNYVANESPRRSTEALVLARSRNTTYGSLWGIGEQNLSDIQALVNEMVMDDISCANRCDDSTMLPCSCDAACLVYKNCCEDFLEQCPDNYNLNSNETILRPDLLQALVVCSPENYVLMISNKEVERNHSRHIWAKFFETREKAPYTDRHTGLVFFNKESYDMYATDKSDGYTWGVSAEPDLFPKKQSNWKLDEDAKSPFRYRDPYDSSRLMPCFKEAIGFCPEETENTELVQACENTSGFIRASMDMNMTDQWLTFKNRHCLFCNTHLLSNVTAIHAVTTPTLVLREDRFRVLADVNTKELVNFYAPRSAPIAWHSASCSVEENKCQITQCKNPALDTENSCMEEVRILLRVSIDPRMGRVSNPEEVRQRLICGFKKRTDYEFTCDASETAFIKGDSEQEYIYMHSELVSFLGPSQVGALFDNYLSELVAKSYIMTALEEAKASNSYEDKNSGVTATPGIRMDSWLFLNGKGKKVVDDGTSEQTDDVTSSTTTDDRNVDGDAGEPTFNITSSMNWVASGDFYLPPTFNVCSVAYFKRKSLSLAEQEHYCKYNTIVVNITDLENTTVTFLDCVIDKGDNNGQASPKPFLITGCSALLAAVLSMLFADYLNYPLYPGLALRG